MKTKVTKKSPAPAKAISKPASKSAPKFKCARIAILGRPNAGKSTLLNALLDVELSAVSKRPQTTRSNIRGIIQRYDSKKQWTAQLVFMDTPGVNFKKGLLDRSMSMSIRGALENVDLVLWLSDAPSWERDLRDLEAKRPGDDKLAGFLADELSKKTVPWILGVSKVDRADKGRLLPLIERTAKLNLFTDIIPLSSVMGLESDYSNLETLLKYVESLAPNRAPEFSEDDWTDLSAKSIIQNLVREAIFRQTQEEVPYQSDCTIMSFKEGEEGKRRTEVHATIWASKDSLKPILVGAKGSRIKELGSTVRQRYQDITGEDIVLKMFVKVVDKWESRATNLSELGYNISV